MKLLVLLPKRDYQFLEVNKFLRRLHPEIMQQAIDEMTKLNGVIP